MKIICIASPNDQPNEAGVVAELCKLGIESFHVRKPGHSRETVREYVDAIPQEHHSKLVLHSHHSLLDEFEVKGAHLTEDARENNRSTTGHLVSTGFHSVEDLRRAADGYDYVFLSPIFDSISKQGYRGKFNPAGLLHLLDGETRPVVALGGITAERIPVLREAGFWGAAVLGSIWNVDNPIEALKELQKECQNGSVH